MVKESSKEISCPQFNNYIILSELSNPPTLTVMPPWKKEYIDLLRRNIEEYRNIDFIDNRRDVAYNDVLESSGGKISGEKREGKKYTKKSFFKIKKFTQEEDTVLMKIQKLDNKTIIDLSKRFNRNSGSIRHRFMKLRRTGSSKKSRSSFSLEEDFLIVDKVLKCRSKSGRLKDFKIKNFGELANSFGRCGVSVYNRWNRTLKIWLLGYYTKTLNLEIRTMLSKYLADNYQDFKSIDWESVCHQKEFSGHTAFSLKSIFHEFLLPNAERFLNLSPSQIKLEQIADSSDEIYKHAGKVTKAVKKRQMEVINYFEKSVKRLKITDFL